MPHIIDIKPASAVALEIEKGKGIKVVDVEGQQVADFIAFNKEDLNERFSTGKTRSENGKIRISVGDVLYSTHFRPMFRITEDSSGVHDILYPPCSRWIFENRYKTKPHDGCLENLTNALSKWGITKLDIPDPFNIFSHTTVDTDGRLRIIEPLSKAGTYILMKAEMNCLVGVSACAVDVATTNAGRCKPIRLEIM